MTTARPGAASRISPGRVTGRLFRSCPDTVIWLAMVGATARAAGDIGSAGHKGRCRRSWPARDAAGAGFGFAAGCRLACGAVTLIVGSAVAFDGVADGSGVTAGGLALAGAVSVGGAVCAHALQHSDDSRSVTVTNDATPSTTATQVICATSALDRRLPSACVVSMTLSIKVHTDRDTCPGDARMRCRHFRGQRCSG